jgi:outer membrane lipoprotein-sorting protein
VTPTTNTRSTGFSAAVLLATLAMLGGCAPKRAPDLPAYRWIDTQTAIDDLRARAASVKTVSAECTITLTRPDGETVQLDGAMAMRNPGWLRLRAWKFNRAVFDLTLQPAGLWIMTMDDPNRRDELMPATVNSAEFVKQWSYFNGALFDLADPKRSTVEGETLILRAPQVGKATPKKFVCEVDRVNLTPRSYRYDDTGPRFRLDLENYREINGVLWPTKLVARGDMGTVTIEQRNVEINAELAENAFTPPRRAEKQP